MTKSLLASSSDVKLGIMLLFRFHYQAILTVTEVGKYSADVLIVNKRKELVEFEVKASIADFKNDFTNKVPKHTRYNQSLNEEKEEDINSVPHYFYFVVPETMASEVASKLASYPNYGLITYRNIPFEPSVNWLLASKFFKFIKEPKRLRNKKITYDETFTMQKRLSSELLREKIKSIKGTYE